MAKHSTPLIIREIKNTTTMQYHLSLIRMAKINNTGNKRCWQGCGEWGTFLHSWRQCKLVQPLCKTVWRLLKKLKIELPYEPAIALLGIYPKAIKTLIQRDTCTLKFIAALSTISKLWKEPKCPSTDEWIKKMWCVCVCVYTHKHTMECYSAIKKNGILPFAMTWMELECIMLSEISQSEKDNTI